MSAVLPKPPVDSDGLRDLPAAGAWLDSYLAETTRQRDEVAARETRASWLRLVTFAGVIAAWILLARMPWLAAGCSAALVIAFAAAVRAHLRLRRRREQLDRCVTVATETRSRFGGQVVCVRSPSPPQIADELRAAVTPLFDDGPQWPLTGQEIGDLDLFSGEAGIFGLVNRASTAIGADRLRHFLVHPLLSPQQILARQQAVRWLADRPRERLELMAACAALRDEDARLAKLVGALESAEPLRTTPPVAVLRAWSVVTAACTLVGLVAALAGAFAAAGALGGVLLVNMALLVRLYGRLAGVRQPWQDVGWAVEGLGEAAQAAVRWLPEELPRLGALRAAFVEAMRDGALSRLARRVGWSESGGLMALMANVVVLLDLHVAAAILAIAVPRREALLRAVAALAELEALASLAALAWEQPVACFPRPADETRITLRGGVHPLIDPQAVVANDVHLDARERFWVITGSNMAGKSTLLRMVAVNVLLAQAGGPATAREMIWRPVRLMTDLRASDNLARHESYFLAEVRHLRRMVVPPPGHEPLLGIIDEPFRGTNSADQTAASVAVVRYLLESHNLFLLATHDRHLTELAGEAAQAEPNGAPLRNYHFRENLGRDGMVFDYLLHEGPATTRNALLILEKEGYPPELMREAHRWHERIE